MSEVVWEDWKLKAQVVVKLRRENTNMLVSQSLSQVLALRTSDDQTPRPRPSPRSRCQSRGRPHIDISEKEHMATMTTT